jgi:PAS domain S-box-containing protein
MSYAQERTMAEFLANLMMSDLFIPHGHCYLWNMQLVGLHLGSDLTIAIAYFSIPLTLFYFVDRREDLPFNWIFSLFGAFIILCGATHLLEVWTLWHPVYWLSGGLKAVTAIVSAYTAVVLFRLMPQALSLVSPAQLAAANREIQQLNEALEARVAERTQELETSMQQAADLTDRLTLAIDAAQLGICDWNIVNQTINWNTYHEQLLDYQPGAASEYTYADWERRVHPDDLGRVMAAIDLAMSSHTDYTSEYRIILLDGSVRWLNGFGRFYYDLDGQPIRMTGLAMDITDRKQAELALLASEERLKLTIDAARIGTFDWNLVNQKIAWNAYHMALLGYAPTALEASSYEAWERRVAPEDLTRVKAAVQLCRDTHTDYACEYRVIWDDGSLRWVEAFGKFYYDGDGVAIRMTGIISDITDRKQAELALQQSEQRYRSLIQATAQIVWNTAADGHVVTELSSWAAFTGQSFEEYRGWGWLEAIHPADRARTNDLWLASVNNLTTFAIEHRLRRYDGEYRDMNVRGVPILNEAGSVIEWIGIHTDITARKQDEANLRRSEEFNRRILENNKDCIKVLDLEGRLLYMNNGGKKLMEINDFASVDRSFWLDFWGGSDQDLARSAFAMAKGGKVSKFEGQCPTVTGLPKWWQVTVAPIFDDRGQVEQILSISHDITDRIQSELAIRESEDRFRSTFEQAAVGVAHVSLDGRWLLVNQKVCEIVGYTEAELLNLNFQAMTHPDDLAQDRENIRQILAGEIRVVKFEKRYIHKLGHPIWINLTGTVRYNAAGEPMYFIASFENIDERKQAEFALQAQTITLAKTTALAERRNQELDQFARIVSHDLKAPLRAIANLSEWIEEDLAGKIEPETQTNLELMRSRVYRMENLINGLLDYARVGQTPASLDTFSVEDLLAEIIDSLNIPPSFTLELPTDLPPLTSNRILLSQVFANLIGNASKHHDRADGYIQITAEPAAQIWTFTVTDDGPGIAEPDQERAFGIFQTLAARDKKENTGIGLSIVKKIVESQGGKISIISPTNSELGNGTTFRFTWIDKGGVES